MRFKVIVVLAVLGSLALSGCSEQADPVCDELETLRGSIATLGDLTLEEGALEQLQSTVTQIQADAEPEYVACSLGGLLPEFIGDEHYVTSVYGVLDPPEGRFTYVNCGHVVPLLFRSDGRVESVLRNTGYGPGLV